MITSPKCQLNLICIIGEVHLITSPECQMLNLIYIIGEDGTFNHMSRVSDVIIHTNNIHNRGSTFNHDSRVSDVIIHTNNIR